MQHKPQNHTNHATSGVANTGNLSQIITVGLAVFSMFFGAGNLIYPIAVGMNSGQHVLWGILAFTTSSVLLPLVGMVAMILFDGDYNQFFARLGNIPGKLLILSCMIIIGPLIAIPRIVTLSHVMIAPFIPIEFMQTICPSSSLIFALAFLGTTFLCTYKENKLIDLLGVVISPLLLISIMVIVTVGLLNANAPVMVGSNPLFVYTENFLRGYETLDLLGAIFFSSIVLSIIKKSAIASASHNSKRFAMIGLQAGILGLTLLGLVYAGLSIQGAFYGYGMAGANAGELFREVSLRILGRSGALVIATAVLMACLSTAMGLAAVIGEYVQKIIFQERICFVSSLILTLVACLPLCVAGLGKVLALTAGPITFVGYPVLIALTVCNAAYKLVGFKSVKLPVLVTFALAVAIYFAW